MLESIVLLISTVARAIAALFAFRLAFITGRRITWGLMGVSFSLLAYRWAFEWYRYITNSPYHHPDVIDDILHFVLSLLMLVGMAMVTSLTQSYLASEDSLKHEKAETLEELRAQRDFAQRIIDNMPGQIAYLDCDLVFKLSNPLNDKILGVGPLEGRNLFEALPGSRDSIGQVIEKVLKTKQPVSETSSPLVYSVNGNQVVQYYDVIDYPIFDAHGNIEGILILAVEVSERVEKEKLQQEQIENLKQADRIKDEFLSVMGHELRTPLNAVIGFGSLLEDGVLGPLTEPQNETVGKILTGADKMLALIDDLLDYARMRAGKFDLFLVETDYACLAEETIASFRHDAEVRKIRIESAIEVGDSVRVDPRRIRQVLANLLSNAMKFTPDGGHILVKAYFAENRLVTEVADTGIGVSAEDLSKLFIPFRQLDMGLTRKVGGIGLGLSISKALVEAHNGRMSVRSEPGKGSVFCFELPRDLWIQASG